MGNNLITLSLIMVILLLAIDLGTMLLLGSSEAVATAKVQYKALSTKQVKSWAEHEGLLNTMADQGRVFDCFISMANIAAFRK
jgi:hypothetical protein